MSRIADIPGRLYRGEVSINFVGRKRLWYTISGLILLVSVIALATRGLNFGIEFKGGSILQFNAPGATVATLHNALINSPAGSQAIVQHVGFGSSWHVQSAKLSYKALTQVEAAISHHVHVTGAFSPTFVGPTWGSEISTKALKALIIFLIVIVIYLSIAFEWKMASAAFVALLHDIVITVGVYALAGFTVSPASVIGLLTILGYSLYDTVVVFDKVRENTAGLLGSGKSSYSQAANLALNQTLVRSINTSLIALLPVAAILFIGTAVLGPGELQDLALVLFVGMLSGTYSSICIATPVLADLKEREHQYKVLAKRVALRDSGGRAARRQAGKPGQVPAGQASAGQVPDGQVLADQALADQALAGAAAGPSVRAAPAELPSAQVADDFIPDEPEEAQQPAGPPPAEAVPAGQGASPGTPSRGGARPMPRQQPRRPGTAKRRPSGKKKKR